MCPVRSVSCKLGHLLFLKSSSSLLRPHRLSFLLATREVEWNEPKNAKTHLLLWWLGGDPMSVSRWLGDLVSLF